MIMQNLGGWGGGGDWVGEQIRCIVGDVQVGYRIKYEAKGTLVSDCVVDILDHFLN